MKCNGNCVTDCLVVSEHWTLEIIHPIEVSQLASWQFLEDHQILT